MVQKYSTFAEIRSAILYACSTIYIENLIQSVFITSCQSQKRSQDELLRIITIELRAVECIQKGDLLEHGTSSHISNMINYTYFQ